MNHEEALRLWAAERYLQGELDVKQRDDFEDHFFACTDCAVEVRLVAAMLDQMKIELAKDPSPRAKLFEN